jgi:hypothetical protein
VSEPPRLTLERVGARPDPLPLSRWHFLLTRCIRDLLRLPDVWERERRCQIT